MLRARYSDWSKTYCYGIDETYDYLPLHPDKKFQLQKLSFFWHDHLKQVTIPNMEH
jgi:hypothetical protein